MIDITKIKVGSKVHYIPYPGCNESKYEKGIVKEIPSRTKEYVLVVYKCRGNWDNFMDYTGVLTNIKDLEYGWEYKARIVVICGSSKYTDIMVVTAWYLEKYEAKIAMSLRLLPVWYTNIPDHLAEHEGIADQMDALHLRKINIADEVFVVDFDDYIGESTYREIKYAEKLGKPIRYFSKDYIGTKVLEKILKCTSNQDN